MAGQESSVLSWQNHHTHTHTHAATHLLKHSVCAIRKSRDVLVWEKSTGEGKKEIQILSADLKEERLRLRIKNLKRKGLIQNNTKDTSQQEGFIETHWTDVEGGRVCCMLHRFLTIKRDWWSCREAGAHQSAEHDLCSVPPCDFPAATLNLLPNLCSSASAARTKPQRREAGGSRRWERREGRLFSRCLQFCWIQ